MSCCLLCLKDLASHVPKLTLQCQAEKIVMWDSLVFYFWILSQGFPCILPVILCPPVGRFWDTMSKSLLGIKSGVMDCETICMYCYFGIEILSLQNFYHREKEKKYCWRYTAVYGTPEINVVSKLVLCFWFPLYWNRSIYRLVQLFFSQCFLPKIVILHLE